MYYSLVILTFGVVILAYQMALKATIGYVARYKRNNEPDESIVNYWHQLSKHAKFTYRVYVPKKFIDDPPLYFLTVDPKEIIVLSFEDKVFFIVVLAFTLIAFHDGIIRAQSIMLVIGLLVLVSMLIGMYSGIDRKSRG